LGDIIFRDTGGDTLEVAGCFRGRNRILG